jgi:hypothetical protein
MLEEKLDAHAAFGEVPREPVILWGWGSLPDQTIATATTIRARGR